MSQEEDVFDVVVGLVAPGGLLARFPRVDPLENAEAAGGWGGWGGGGGGEEERNKR